MSQEVSEEVSEVSVVTLERVIQNKLQSSYCVMNSVTSFISLSEASHGSLLAQVCLEVSVAPA